MPSGLNFFNFTTVFQKKQPNTHTGFDYLQIIKKLLRLYTESTERNSKIIFCFYLLSEVLLYV